MKNTFFLLPLLTELSLSPSIHGDRRRLHIRLKQLEISRQKLQLINSLSHLINSLIKVMTLKKSRISFFTMMMMIKTYIYKTTFLVRVCVCVRVRVRVCVCVVAPVSKGSCTKQKLFFFLIVRKNKSFAQLEA